MSFLRPEKPTTPVQKYIECNKKEGFFFYKTKKDNGEKEIYKFKDIKFTFLFSKSGVIGWNNATDTGIYSNRVDNTTREELRVAHGKGVIAKGIYQKIKPQIMEAGGKFANFLYVLVDNEIACITASGAANFISDETEATWANCKVKTRQNSVTVKKYKKGGTGTSAYVMPIFEDGGALTDEDVKLAIAKTEELKVFFKDLKEYEDFLENENEEVEEPISEEKKNKIEEFKAIKPEDLPF